MKDVDRKRITKVYACCPEGPFGGGGGVIRALQSNINICYSPKPAAPHTYKRSSSAWDLAGSVDENGQPLTTHSVWYHSLSGTISFRLQGNYMSATSQARLYGVLGRTSVFETFLCRQVCSHSAQINQFAANFLIGRTSHCEALRN